MSEQLNTSQLSESGVHGSISGEQVAPENISASSFRVEITAVEEVKPYHDRLAEHTAALKAQVDAVRGVDPDTKNLITNLQSIGMGAFVACVGSFSNLLIEYPAAVAIPLAVIGTSTGWRHDLRRQDRNRRKELTELSVTTQGVVGQPYELYRSGDPKDPKVLMRWRAEKIFLSKGDQYGMAAELKHLAQCADAAGVDQLTMPMSLATDFLSYDKTKDPFSTATIADWADHISQFRGIPDSVEKKHHQIYAMPPKVWADIAKPEVYRQELGAEVDSLVEQLAKLDNKHSMLTTYKKLEKDPKLRAEAVIDDARTFLDRSLSNTETYANPEEVKVRKTAPRKTDTPETKTPSKLPYLSKMSRFEEVGTMSSDGLWVTWRTRFGSRKQDSLAVLGLDKLPEMLVKRYDPNADMRSLLETGAQKLIETTVQELAKNLGAAEDLQLAKQACAVLIQRKLAAILETMRADKPPSPTSETQKAAEQRRTVSSTGKADIMLPTGTDEIVQNERPNMLTYYKRKVILGVAAGAITLVALAGADELLILNVHAGESSQSAAGAIGGVNLGTPNTLIANLQGQGMATEGYWATNESTTYNKGAWMPDDTTQAWSKLLPLAPTSKTWIKVTLDDVGSAHDVGNNMEQIDIPVLQGTMPIAGEYGGKQVTLQEATNNTYSILVPHISSKNPDLSYWVSYQQGGMNPRSTKKVKVVSDSLFNDKEDQAVIDKAIPDARSSEGIAIRAAMVAYYTKNAFNYSVQPPHAKPIESYSKISDWLGDTLNSKVVNCNIVSTVIEFSEPYGDIGVAWGFSNKGSKQPNVLSAHEQHMWNVTEDGDITDGVPYKGMSQSDQDFFNAPIVDTPAKPKTASENTLAQVELVSKIFAGTLGLGALGSAVVYRRQLIAKGRLLPGQARKTAIQTAAAVAEPLKIVPRAYANYRLNNTDPEALNYALAAIEQVAYGAPASTKPYLFWSNTPISHAPLQASHYQRSRSPETVKSTLLDPNRPGLRHRALEDRLKKQSKTPGRSAEQRRQFKKLSRIVAWSRTVVERTKVDEKKSPSATL